jgi:transcriptional regulator with XRE-family HTH domain
MAAKRNPPSSLTDQLRGIIEDCGVSRYEICKQTGVDKAALSRFVSGERSLTLEAVDRMAAFLGLKLTGKRKAKRPKER